MRSTLISLACVTALLACDDGSADGDDAGSTRDAGRIDGGRVDGGPVAEDAGGTRDAGVDSGMRDAGPDPSTRCGTAMPDVSSIRGTEGLIVARDGTIYFSQSRAVGRMTPDGTIDADWVAVPGSTVWGLALDAANRTLYVGVPTVGVYRIDTQAATPSASRVVERGQANGLTIAPDDSLYYSDFGEGRVYRLAPGASSPTEVTQSRIAGANGVAFEAGGTLLVASYSQGIVYRLQLADHRETSRAPVFEDDISPDGIAVDARGRIYVTDNSGGALIRVDADGGDPQVLIPNGISAAASLDFGRGALSCTDLYIASRGAVRRYAADAPGAAVPWH